MHEFWTQPERAVALFSLLDTVFPGIAQAAERIRGLGVSWEGASTPFVFEEAGAALAHVGLIELPLVLEGRETVVGSVHAVATRADQRGRGLYRAVMTRLLAWCESRFSTLVLTTEHPEYFTPFGFRHCPEAAFRLAVDHAGPREPLRLLELSQPQDLALLHRLLSTREPLSHRLGVVREQAIFCFNMGRQDLWYSQALDALCCFERQGTGLRLLDLVAPRLPAWPQLLACLPGPLKEIIFEFSPDRLAPQALPQPRLLDHDGPSWLMVRGPWLPEGTPFTLPIPART